MPFGLRNAAQTFQRFMNKVLQGLDFAHVYIDDLLIASLSPQEHLQHLQLVFQQLEEHGIVINVPKSHFGVQELVFLGHHVDATGIRPLEEKVQAIREFSLPDTQRKLRRFLGLVNFYRRFIPGGAAILQPLHSLLKRTKCPADSPPWTTAVFYKVKHALANATLLVHLVPNAPTGVMTDASDVAVGAILQQYINGHWCPRSFFSRALTSARTRYSTYDHELLAIYCLSGISGISSKAGIFTYSRTQTDYVRPRLSP
jgi:hypothetical protein